MMPSSGTIVVDGITYVVSSPGPGVVVAHEPSRPNQVASLRWGSAVRRSGDVVWMAGALDSRRAPLEHQERLELAMLEYVGLTTETSPAAGTADGRAAGRLDSSTTVEDGRDPRRGGVDEGKPG